MNKRIVFAIMAAIMLTAPAQAQSEKARQVGKDIQGAVTDFFKKAKKGVNQTVEAINEEFSNDTVGVRYIDGNRYMCIYDTNLYNQSDAAELMERCRADFGAHYPVAHIISCVIPQQQWEEIPVRRNGDIVSYRFRLNCYVVARDGNQGYINARYRFEKTKKIGQSIVNNDDRWPERVRVNALTPSIYEKLKK